MKTLLWLILAAALFGLACRDPNNGQSSASEAPIADGQIVLIRTNNNVGAFVLSNQRLSPEMTDYAWYSRSDGKGTFPSGDPAVTSGFVSNANRVVFGQFALGWSINRPGIGWVYFSAGPAQFGMTPEFTMCVTTETNIAAVNANDSRWTFRGRPSLNMRALIESQTKKP